MTDVAAKSLTVDLTRYIDKRHFGERPHIRGRRIPVWIIAHAMLDNADIGVPELMYSYDLSEPEVLAALLYYQIYSYEVEALEEETRAKVHHRHKMVMLHETGLLF